MDRPSISIAAPSWRDMAAEWARTSDAAPVTRAELGMMALAIGAEVAGTSAELGKEMVTYEEFAKRVGRCLRTVKYWGSRKIITVIKIGGVVMIHYPTAVAELKARGIESKTTGVVATMQRRAA